MPGSFFEPLCSGCGATHEIQTGSSNCLPHGNSFLMEQMVCPSCETLRSVIGTECCRARNCSECGTELTPWAGRVWFEDREEPGSAVEHVEGPCPRCGTSISKRDSQILGLWD